MKIQLSDHFTAQRLLRFVAPSILMMIFTSIYGVVDGLFVSNFVGKTSFSAINLMMPMLMGMGSLGFMLGTGGSALVAKTLGEGDREKANRLFSMLVYVTLSGGLAVTALGLIWIRPFAVALGAEGPMLEDCVLYGRIILLSETAFMLQNLFQSFFVTGEKPHLGLAVTVAAGLTNMVLDFLFIVPLGWGLAGAAAATALSETVGGLVPLLYFSRHNSSLLRLIPAKPDWKALQKACANGSSELMTNLSMSLVNILYNLQLMRMVGPDGVAAYGVIMYVNFFFVAIFLGYSIGIAPVIGYHFGADNKGELKNLLLKSLILLGLTGCVLTVLAEGLAFPLASVFVGYDQALLGLTGHGLRLYSLSFLLVGLNIFGSAFFTALNNGAVSAAISFLRTLLFQLTAIFLLPAFLGVDGIWLSVVAAELLASGVTTLCLVQNHARYQYA